MGKNIYYKYLNWMVNRVKYTLNFGGYKTPSMFDKDNTIRIFRTQIV